MNGIGDPGELGDVVREFLVESRENLDQLDRDLVALEREPAARDRLASVFRNVHTIKGTSGFLAFCRLERLTHAGESLLVRLRDGVQELDRGGADALLLMVDTARALMTGIERDGVEPDVDVAPAVEALLGSINDRPPAGLAIRDGPADGRPVPAVVEDGMAGDGMAGDGMAGDGMAGARAGVAEGGAKPGGGRGPAEGTIRVGVHHLDRLMRLVGELVLTRNQVLRAAETAKDAGLSRAAQRLDALTGELQDGVMTTRLQPLESLWSTLPRVVRDLANECGRQVHLVTEGAATELDRGLLEAVKDPLTHLVRNAVDHGIEPPAQRIAAGKPAHGRLILRARHEHGQVVVEVSDDGAGIDPERIGRIAVQRGLLGQQQLDAMDPADVQRLVLRPGFSTADRVSTVSGRGVGMDVVLANLEGVGGTVELSSVPGEGTTWRLTIPLTLAIVPALIVESGGQRFVVPQPAVHELVFLDPPSGCGVEHLLGAAVYRLRGRLLPVVWLSAVLGHRCGDNGDGPGGGYLVVLTADGRRFGLVVDRVLSTEEVVVKPLAARFKHLGCYSGATILGDGRVALILDAPALARRSGLAHVDWPAGGEPVTAARAAGHPRLLVTGVAGRRVAIPLSAVTRLEEFAASSVELVGRREVVQYRGRLLPLVRLRRLLGAPDGGPAGQLPAVVIADGRRGVALAVDEILDIVDGPDGPDGAGFASGPVDDGLAGAAAVQRAVTELLDVRHAILAADPRFFDTGPAHGELDLVRRP